MELGEDRRRNQEARRAVWGRRGEENEAVVDGTGRVPALPSAAPEPAFSAGSATQSKWMSYLWSN